MGIKFKSKTERDNYSFICPSHDCGNTDLYSDKVTTSKEDKSILAVHPSAFFQKLVIKESVNDSTKNQILNNTSSTMVMCTTLQTFCSFN